MATHDATTGFHDIKPLVGFAPIDFVLWGGILAMLVIFVAILLSRRYLRTRPAPPTPETPPDIEAMEKLALLDKKRREGSIGLRELAAALSETLRGYLERALAFSAVEQTTSEVMVAFTDALGDLTDGHDLALQQSQIKELHAALTFLEYLAFAGNSEERFFCDSAEIASQIDQLRGWIKTCGAMIEQAHQRRLAAESARSGQKQASSL